MLHSMSKANRWTYIIQSGCGEGKLRQWHWESSETSRESNLISSVTEGKELEVRDTYVCGGIAWLKKSVMSRDDRPFGVCSIISVRFQSLQLRMAAERVTLWRIRNHIWIYQDKYNCVRRATQCFLSLFFQIHICIYERIIFELVSFYN